MSSQASTEEKQCALHPARRLAVIALVFTVLLGSGLGFAACKGSTVSGGGGGPADRCGYCLNSEQSGGKVCTDQGTMDNSCLALCRGAEIFCEQSCPCPRKK